MSTFPPYFLFSLRLEAKSVPAGRAKLTPEFLSEKYELPALGNFAPHQSPSPRRGARTDAARPAGTADFHVRFGWRADGLFLTVILRGKNRPVTVTPQQLETSDSFSLMLDTRDVRVIHRATKFCHRLLFTPADPENSAPGAAPGAVWLPIHRAKAHPTPVDVTRFETAYAARKDGWSLSVFIPGDTLTGYDPAEHTRIGLSYVLFDNEFGWLAQQLPDYFPVTEDPSLWAAVDLVG